MKTRTIERRIQRPGAGLLGSLTLLPVRAKRVLQEKRETFVARRSASSPIQRRDDLRAFYDAFEAFVETLCDAAQYGPVARLDARYREGRDVYLAAYETVRPYLGAFVPEGEAGDVFRLLAEEPDVAAFLAADDGGTISRITRCREALVRYADHLRHLSA